MQIDKIGSRNIIFSHIDIEEWNCDLNLHLIIGKNRNYIIDTGFGSESIEPIKEYLSGNYKPIIVINTHSDWDHIWGNHCFRNSIIISHKLCRGLIEEHWTETLIDYKQFIRGEVIQCLPNLLIEDTIYFPDDEVRIFYTPGHTVDCISVFDEHDNVLNVGDNIGDTISEIVPEINTDKATYIQTIQKYKSLNIEACISGHNKILGQEIFDKIIETLGSK